MTVKKVKRWKPSKDADSHCDGRVEECFCDQLDDLGDCIDCGSTQKERGIDASNEQQTPIVESSRPDVIEDAIEMLAVEFIDRVALIAETTDNAIQTMEHRLAAFVRAGRPFSDVMQIFAGFVTEHTMGVIAEGGPRGGDVQARVKLQDSRASLIERNGNGDTAKN